MTDETTTCESYIVGVRMFPVLHTDITFILCCKCMYGLSFQKMSRNNIILSPGIQHVVQKRSINWINNVPLKRIFVNEKEIQVEGKRLMRPFLRHWILGTSKVILQGFCPYTRHVANAAAKTPQSLPLLCCWTGMFEILFKSGSNYFSFMRLSNNLTLPGRHPIEVKHTQWLLPTCNIWINSDVMVSNCLTGPSVGLWNPSIFGLKKITLWWIGGQNSRMKFWYFVV